MMKNNSPRGHDVTSQESHRCGPLCLGPLTFHPQAVGDMVRLSHGHRLAERNKNTFKNGLVFSSRPVKVQERIRVRVEKDAFNWTGSLRVGFTTVSPSGRTLPLPCMAIPDLTKTPGHWVVVVRDDYCQVGSELQFWVSTSGSIYVTCNNSGKIKLLTGVDLSRPLWAVIDIYGQTHSIALLGSVKPGLFSRRSCPAPEILPSRHYQNRLSLVSDYSSLDGNSYDDLSSNDMDISQDNSCVVCMVKEAIITLTCGHQCLCQYCSFKVSQQFGTCPLCRQKITHPSVQRSVPALI